MASHWAVTDVRVALVASRFVPHYTTTPPEAIRREHVHREHGVDRLDPYYWMRDKDNPEVFAHLQREREFYDQETAPLRGLVDRLTAEIVARVPTTDESARWREGKHEYFTRVVEGQEFEQFCRVETDGTVTVLLDDNELLGDSSYVELGVRSVSPDGRVRRSRFFFDATPPFGA